MTRRLIVWLAGVRHRSDRVVVRAGCSCPASSRSVPERTGLVTGREDEALSGLVEQAEAVDGGQIMISALPITLSIGMKLRA